MRGSLQNRFATPLWPLLLVFCLISCMGGGSAEMGGTPGAPGAGQVGGPMDAASGQAAGPLSIPAPASVAREPEGGAYVSCKKLEGDRAECSGSTTSAPAGSQIRLSVHPYGYASREDVLLNLFVGTAHAAGFTATVTADGNGAWRSDVTGNAGETVEICWMKNAVCSSRTVLTLPTAGNTVSWGTDKLKNLIHDNQGNGYYSRRLPPAKTMKKDWLDWLIPSAHAEEDGGGSPYWGGLITDSGTMPFYVFGFSAAVECPHAASENLFEVVGDNPNTRHSRVYWAPAGSTGAPRVIPLRGGTQNDISGILPFADSGSRDTYLAVAVDKSVQLLKREGDTYRLTFTFNYPYVVDEILDIGSRLLVLPKMSAVNPNTGKLIVTWPAAFEISKNITAGARSQCVAAQDVMKNYELLVSHDFYQGGFAWVARHGESDFRVVAGFGGTGDGVFQVSPFLVQSFDRPVQVRVVDSSPDRLILAVLDSAQKTLRFFQYKLTPSPTLQKSLEVALGTLTVGSRLLAVHVPTQFAIDRIHQTLAFVDVANEGWSAVTIPYVITDGEIMAPNQAAIGETGTVAPQAFTRNSTQNLWTYGQVSDGAYTMSTYRSTYDTDSAAAASGEPTAEMPISPIVFTPGGWGVTVDINSTTATNPSNPEGDTPMSPIQFLPGGWGTTIPIDRSTEDE